MSSPTMTKRAEAHARLGAAAAMPIPRSQSRWSYQQAVRFKEAHARAVRLLANERATAQTLESSAKDLEAFHQEDEDAGRDAFMSGATT